MEDGNSVRTERRGRQEPSCTFGTLLGNKVADYVEPEFCDGVQSRRINTSTGSTDTAERERAVAQTASLIYPEARVTPRERYLNTFKELVDEMYALTQRKNADYASEESPFKNFSEFGTMGFLVRISDKWSRIRNLLSSGKAPAVKDEKVEDTLLDLATYSILLICWLREGN